MNGIEVTLPREQWQAIRDAADKASPASLYEDYPGLFGSYHGIVRAVGDVLQADAAPSALTIRLLPTTLASIFTLPEFNGLRQGMPPREEWFGARS